MQRTPATVRWMVALAALGTGASAEPAAVTSRYDDDASLPAHAKSVADYTLTATLDPSAHTVHGEGTIQWTNTASKPTRELWFHLYLNAFKNDRSVFLREPVGGFRGGDPVADWGSIDVRTLAWADGGTTHDLWKSVELHRDGDDDETDARVPLPREVAPGETVTLSVTWDDKLPSVVERTGYHGDFHMVAQWFPKLARREPDGRWAHFPFHHLAEFYADYGTYDVTLRVPKGVVVGATGSITESRDEGDQHVERRVQSDVHDFAWTAWREFQRRQESIDGVKVEILYPPHFDYAAERELATLRFALPYFGRMYGKYPYPVLTVVHPPSAAREAGGMEYPTLITTGGPWFGPPGVLGLEHVTIHEFGHQYFYGLLGSDEVTWPFLDEGLNSFAEQDALRAWRGDGSLLDAPGLKVSDTFAHVVGGNEYATRARVAQPAPSFASGAAYGRLVYARTSTILETLRRVYGDEAFRHALGRYARRARFEHPVPEDLLTSIAEAIGPQAAENARAALFDMATVDYEVASVSSNASGTSAGLFDRDGKRETTKRETTKGAFEGWALVTRKGALTFPVDIELVAEDGSRKRTRWDGAGGWTRVAWSGASPLAYAVVDPDRNVLLDMDPTNNAAKSSSAHAGSTARTFERVTWWTELALAGIGP